MSVFLTKTKPLKARVKQRYSDFIVEEIFLEENEEKKCSVQRFDKSFEEREERKELIIPEKNGKEHLILELEKINTETNKAIALLSRGLSISKNRIGYAGLKDKRAITCQRISVFEPVKEKVKGFGVRGLEIRNPRWGERIELGDLKGNYFTIILRNISEEKKEIKSIVEKFFLEAEKGLPNFFGKQRFGGKREITHRVGKLLVKERFEEAVMLYLTETFEEEKKDIKEARINLGKTRDFGRALKEFPKECRTEIAILNKLVKNENDFVGAFNELPKKTRYLFVHAYQSHIFNRILEERIKEFGEKALEKSVLGLLPGFESTFSEGKMGEIEKKVLAEEGISFEEFKIRTQSDLSSKGSEKEIGLYPKRFLLHDVFEDEFNEGKRAVKISFYLEKGNYATTVLRELLKEEVY